MENCTRIISSKQQAEDESQALEGFTTQRYFEMKCKKCGFTIVYAVNEEGRKVALSVTREVYSIVYPGPHDHFQTKRAKKSVYVNHKIVCGSKGFREEREF